jgi:hypothetical protein
MQLLSVISIEDAKELSTFTFTKGPKLHILLPLLFFALALTLLFSWEYYKEWKRKRRMRRYWTNRPGSVQK